MTRDNSVMTKTESGGKFIDLCTYSSSNVSWTIIYVFWVCKYNYSRYKKNLCKRYHARQNSGRKKENVRSKDRKIEIVQKNARWPMFFFLLILVKDTIICLMLVFGHSKYVRSIFNSCPNSKIKWFFA